MLTIDVPITDEMWDETTNEFIPAKVQTLQLEHSLVSLSKWESKWHKAFMTKEDKTTEEILDYIKCMTITRGVDPAIYNRLTADNFGAINDYINDSMTATTFREDKNSRGNREIITSELIYYWMFSLQIPIECEKWHISRLITLIRVFNVKNAPTKKMSKRDITSRNAALNAARRQKYNSKG